MDESQDQREMRAFYLLNLMLKFGCEISHYSNEEVGKEHGALVWSDLDYV